MVFKLVPNYKRNTMTRKQDIFDDFFDNFFSDDFLAPLRNIETKMTSGFRVDVLDNGDHYLIEADLPGFEKENVKIEYENKYLTITARKEASEEINQENYIRRERQWGEYRRSFYIDNIIPEEIEAKFKNGVLKIKVSKEPISKDIKEIEIE
jgi:HSP20 family protein